MIPPLGTSRRRVPSATEHDRDWNLRNLVRGSRYPASAQRDERIDLLRGVAVAVMLMDHIGGWSPIRWLTGNAEFYVTAAEAFVSISGFIFGVLYRKNLETRGPRAVFQRALRRSLVLYVTMLAMTVVLAGGALVVGLEWAPPVHGPGEFAIFMFRIATFQTMFRVARILGVYALLVPLGAFAVVLMGRGWTRILLLISWLVYGIYQIDPHRFGWPFPESAYFHPYAYQVLFLHLVALGYHRDWFARFFDFRRQRALFIVSAGVFLALIVLHACQHAVLPVRLDMQLDRIFDGRFLRPGRLLALVFVGPAFYLAITYFWLPIHRHVGGLFMPLGRHALYCYAMHAPFVVLFDRLSSSWAALGRWAALPNAVAQLTVLGILCAMVRFRVLFRLFPVEAKPAR